MKSKPQSLVKQITLVYEGPEEFRVIVWSPPGREKTTVTFVRDEPQKIDADLAEHLLELNPRGCALEDARDYGAQLFSVHKPSKGDDQ